MRIIARPKLIAFGNRFPDAKPQLDAWWAEAKQTEWKTPADIKAQYRSASILKGGRVVFNICGNKYRLIVTFDYEKGILPSEVGGGESTISLVQRAARYAREDSVHCSGIIIEPTVAWCPAEL